MNYRLSAFIVAAILMSFAASSSAQSRIAFIDGTKLVKRMPEAVDAESRLDQIITGWNKELSDLEADLKRKREDYDRKRLIMAEAERTAVENDITELKNRIDRFRQEKYGTSGELYKQQAELMKPAYDRLMKAIEEVAVEGKYDYVFDRGAKDYSILYTNAKFDLSLPVAKKLGLETSDIFNIPLLNNPLNPGKPSPNNPGSTPPDPRNQPVPPPMNPGEMQPGQVPPPLPH